MNNSSQFNTTIELIVRHNQTKKIVDSGYIVGPNDYIMHRIRGTKDIRVYVQQNKSYKVLEPCDRLTNTVVYEGRVLVVSTPLGAYRAWAGKDPSTGKAKQQIEELSPEHLSEVLADIPKDPIGATADEREEGTATSHMSDEAATVPIGYQPAERIATQVRRHPFGCMVFRKRQVLQEFGRGGAGKKVVADIANCLSQCGVYLHGDLKQDGCPYVLVVAQGGWLETHAPDLLGLEDPVEILNQVPSRLAAA